MQAPPATTRESLDDVSESCRSLLNTMFSSLRELYVFCEEHQRADIGGEVVDALSMCQEDFSVLVDRLRSYSERCRRSADGSSLTVSVGISNSPCASPSASSSASPSASPLAQLNSPESNSHMLAALEALELDELQEASRYFEVGGPLLPRKAHEKLYLERACAEGREAAAKRFLVTLNRMASTASAQRQCTDEDVSASAPTGLAEAKGATQHSIDATVASTRAGLESASSLDGQTLKVSPLARHDRLACIVGYCPWTWKVAALVQHVRVLCHADATFCSTSIRSR